MAYRDDERHPSFSAPGTLDRKKTNQNSFLASAKEMFLKPWQQRKSKQVKRQPKPHSCLPVVPAAQAASATTNSLPYMDQHSNNPFRQGIPNFQNRLAPIGGRPSPSPQRPSKDQVDGEAYSKPDEIQIPEGVSGARPSLKNIFPTFDAAAKTDTVAKTTPTPKAAVVKPKLAVEQKTAGKPQSAKPPVGLPMVTTIADVAPPPENLPRRHSMPATPTTNFLKAAGLEDRRPSASSDTTADKSRQERRDRRACLTRDLPILPKRGQSPSGQGSPEYSGPPLASLAPLGGAVQQRPPVAPGGGAGVGGATGGGGGKVQQSFPYPAMWSQQTHQQLQELEEELEEDGEGDGMEEPSFTRIDETSSEYLPKVYGGHTTEATPPPAKEPSGGGGMAGFGRALKDMMSSKRKSDPVSGKPPGKGRGGGRKGKNLDEEEGPEIKGFDNFFMY